MSVIRRFAAYLWHLPKLYTIPVAIIIVAGVVAGAHFATRTTAIEAPPSISHVSVASVASLSAEDGELPLTGTMTSQSKAMILAQTGGEITSLRHTIGDRVAAGEVIGQFENSAQQAAVLQAQGAYEAAQVSLDKVSGTTAQNSSISSAQAQRSAADARTSAATALQSAYNSLDDAIHAKTDAFFGGPRSSTPRLLPYIIPDTQLVANIQNERPNIEKVLNDAEALTSPTSDTDIDSVIGLMTADAQTVLGFTDEIVKAMNQAVPNTTYNAATIAANQATAAAARSEVIGAISALMTAKGSYDAAVSSAATAANSASAGSQSDIASAQAGLKSAEGSLSAAKAALEKTIIRSPISGVIVSLSVNRGDYVSAFSPVAQVSNPGALYIESFVTADDAKTLAVGDTASIEGQASGVITFVAPAIDPTTGKVEVKIGIRSGENTLTDGEVVTVSITRSDHVVSAKTLTTTLPLAALKMTPDGAIVFSVSTTSVLEAHPVTLGTILGNRVIIASGTTPDMQIVTDARGLSEGQAVAVDTQ
jgi:RND family efflux transporter MFP subunit